MIGENKLCIYRLSEHSNKKCKDQWKKELYSHFIRMSTSRERRNKRLLIYALPLRLSFSAVKKTLLVETALSDIKTNQAIRHLESLMKRVADMEVIGKTGWLWLFWGHLVQQSN